MDIAWQRAVPDGKYKLPVWGITSFKLLWKFRTKKEKKKRSVSLGKINTLVSQIRKKKKTC